MKIRTLVNLKIEKQYGMMKAFLNLNSDLEKCLLYSFIGLDFI